MRDPDEGWYRVQLAVQRTRAVSFCVLYAVAMLGAAAGIFAVDPAGAHLLLAFSLGSVAAFHLIFKHRLDVRWGVDLSAAWMAFDVVLITWAVYMSGDPGGPWLVWYVVNAAAAAFVAGRRAMLAVVAANSAAYLCLLVLIGEVRGFDRGLAAGLSRLALIYGAAFIALRAISDLRDKRLEISRLVAEKSAQLDEMHQLTEALNRRTVELGEANLRSEEANRTKSQFLANMSHELRTPLNSIIGFAEILDERVGGDLGERYRKFLGNILNSGRHLLRLINDILDLSKIEAGKMELALEKVAVGDVVEGVRGVMHGTVAHRGIELAADLPDGLPTVICDGPKLKQVLYNLVSNAAKFSPDGGRVTVGARLLPAGDSPLGEPGLWLWVRDHGVGIAAEDHERIFEEFRQVDGGSTRAHGGTGLGLALVRRFVEMQGGRVEVESALGEGSTFHVHLPADVSRARVTGDRHERPPSLEESGRTILVVEDDDPFYNALAADLAAAGYRARRARHGEEAIAALRSERPAAITLDLMLPGLDGWEVLKAIKSDAAHADIPVIIVSVVDNHELGFALGADEFMLKPLDRRVFLHRLEQLIPADGAGAEATVLIVDDDRQLVELLSHDLTGAGYRVEVARDGEEGLVQAATIQPSLILLDVMMPGLDGFEVATRLRSDPATAAIPIVILTAKDLSREERERLGDGIHGLLSKTPLDRQLILRSIHAIENRRAGGMGAADG